MRTPFVARFRLLRVGNTIALAEQNMAQGFDPDLLSWVGAYVMMRASKLMPPSEKKTAAVVSISGHCEEVTDGKDYSIEVREPAIEVAVSEYTEQDNLLFNNCPF